MKRNLQILQNKKNHNKNDVEINNGGMIERFNRWIEVLNKRTSRESWYNYQLTCEKTRSNSHLIEVRKKGTQYHIYSKCWTLFRLHKSFCIQFVKYFKDFLLIVRKLRCGNYVFMKGCLLSDNLCDDKFFNRFGQLPNRTKRIFIQRWSWIECMRFLDYWLRNKTCKNQLNSGWILLTISGNRAVIE